MMSQELLDAYAPDMALDFDETQLDDILGNVGFLSTEAIFNHDNSSLNSGSVDLMGGLMDTCMNVDPLNASSPGSGSHSSLTSLQAESESPLVLEIESQPSPIDMVTIQAPSFQCASPALSDRVSDSGNSTDSGSCVLDMPYEGQRKQAPFTSKIKTHPMILSLSEQEKSMLAKEGWTKPLDLPLTKAEESELKKIRRRIKNKLSAQDSRRRKKQYVRGLETRVEACSVINAGLQKKVSHLEQENKSLIEQLRSLKEVVSKSVASQSKAGTGTLMLLAMSFAMFCAPDLKGTPLAHENSAYSSKIMDTIMTSAPYRGRTLLENDEEETQFSNFEGQAPPSSLFKDFMGSFKLDDSTDLTRRTNAMKSTSNVESDNSLLSNSSTQDIDVLNAPSSVLMDALKQHHQAPACSASSSIHCDSLTHQPTGTIISS